MEPIPLTTAPAPGQPPDTLPYGNIRESHLAPGAEPIPGYRLLGRLGVGGFGQVWSAEAPGGRRVALKFVPAVAKLIEPEVRALHSLRDVRHPHLLEVHFHVLLPDWLVICTPVCEGSLFDRLRASVTAGLKGIPPEELIRYMTETAAALDFLNAPRPETGRAAGLQHRDIKPHNLLLCGGAVRVADLGLAKILERSVGSHSGALTPAYAAPEMFEGYTTARTDQYSLAVSYCELRSGHLPFRGGPAELMHGHLYGEPDLSGLPEAERGVAARGLAKNPADRWASCTEFVGRLREVASEVPRPAGRLRRRLRAWWGGGKYEPPRARANRKKGRRAAVFGLALMGIAGVWGLVPLPEAVFAGMGLTARVMGVGLFGGIGSALFLAGLFNALTGHDCMGGTE